MKLPDFFVFAFPSSILRSATINLLPFPLVSHWAFRYILSHYEYKQKAVARTCLRALRRERGVIGCNDDAGPDLFGLPRTSSADV